jgi:hypothetical protein
MSPMLSTRLPLRRPRPSLLRSGHLPAPSGGINRADPASAMPITDCLTAVNLLGSKYGFRVRPGYQDWVTDLGSPAEGVRSILPFTGSEDDGGSDKLFACTMSGIWDCTTSTATPSQSYTFPTQGADSGYGQGTAFTTIAGHFYAYCDETNGYMAYDESTDTWTLVPAGSGAGQIDGVDPRNLCLVLAWKTRLLFVEKDTANMWYLPVGQLYGTAQKFDFGNKFKFGGPLIGLWHWTIDGGEGVDDYLVAASRGGDVAVYKGTDPSDADAFAQVGQWFVGAVPAGRRIATDFGGDLFIQSVLGLFPLSKLLAGGQIASPDTYTTRNIGPLLSDAMEQRKHLRGWEVRLHPELNALLINTPAWSGQPDEQFVMSLTSSGKGWSIFNGLPMDCTGVWHGKLYFGTNDGRICVNSGVYDNVAIDGGIDDASDVIFSFLSSYQSLGNPNKKQVRLIRPILRVDGASPAYTVRARYDFDESAISETVTAGATTEALWDAAIWDVDLWGAGLEAEKQIAGSVGIGSHVAIALKGECHAEAILIGFDCTWEEGGFL